MNEHILPLINKVTPGSLQLVAADELLRRDAIDGARFLLGKVLVMETPDGKKRRCRIVETEAYHGHEDPSSHAHGGITSRNAPMFAQGGHIYVYLIYGVHHMLNLVTDREGLPSAVLVRAAAPLDQLDADSKDSRKIFNGPGKLCRALGIDRQLSSRRLNDGPLQLFSDGYQSRNVATGSRIGINAGLELPWRFCDTDFRSYLSRPPG
ncbi:DNA-3-methyladenine glycosylase [Desulfurispira natronophila]|uniref:Putative 3-methyladenine DNA glycosylase n=1 Tax=Desulfurispira natronophila TaxID=682562 RepID=A0A7W7Y6F8_9BACT|nr:DNA-3-methyladenine glycosylase [Desulfurispira natronophila]MBB5022809.1 DNA-3-methyladenine glycosylase [Desulfurispira natronophila]